MRYFFPFIFLMVFGMFSCEPCRYADCIGNSSVGIRFNSATDSSDLILSGIYTTASVNIKPLLKGNGSPPSVSTVTSTSSTGSDYMFQLEINDNTLGYAIQIGQLPVDTLLVVGKTETSKCCGTTIDVSALVLNGDTLAFQWNSDMIRLYK